MADDPKIRLGLQIGKSEELVTLEKRFQAVQAAGLELALALGRGEITASEYKDKLKEISPESTQLASAITALTKAQREAAAETDKALKAWTEEARSAAAAAAAVEEAAAEYRKLADAKARADAEDLAHTSELEALALQHQIEMMEHAERELRELTAAEDAEIASLGRSVAADLAAGDAVEALTRDRTAAKITLAQELDFERLDASMKRQVSQAARDLGFAEVMVSGGVAANSALRWQRNRGDGYGWETLESGRV
jgi:hypothetical protein